MVFQCISYWKTTFNYQNNHKGEIRHNAKLVPEIFNKLSVYSTIYALLPSKDAMASFRMKYIATGVHYNGVKISAG